MKIILDTSFIISCVNYKIDFSELNELLPEYEIVVPAEVLRELERVSLDKKAKYRDREAARVGIQILKHATRINLGRRYVDKGILEYMQGNKEDYVATCDKGLKKHLKKVIIIKGAKKLEIRGA